MEINCAVRDKLNGWARKHKLFRKLMAVGNFTDWSVHPRRRGAFDQLGRREYVISCSAWDGSTTCGFSTRKIYVGQDGETRKPLTVKFAPPIEAPALPWLDGCKIWSGTFGPFKYIPEYLEFTSAVFDEIASRPLESYWWKSKPAFPIWLPDGFEAWIIDQELKFTGNDFNDMEYWIKCAISSLEDRNSLSSAVLCMSGADPF